MTNHDITIGEMIDPEDEQQMGLLGRAPELQFVRLAAGYRDMKAERNEVRRQLAALTQQMANFKSQHFKSQQPHVLQEVRTPDFM